MRWKTHIRSVHDGALVLFAAMLALFEGPAEIACVLVLVTTALSVSRRPGTAVLASGARSEATPSGGGRPDSLRPGTAIFRLTWAEAGILLWWLAGIPGLIGREPLPRSEDLFRPALALAFVVGSRALKDVSERTLKRMAWAFGVCIVLNGVYGYLQVAFGALPFDDLFAWNPNKQQRMVPDSDVAYAASGLFYNRLKLAHVGIAGLGLLGLTLVRPRERLRNIERGLILIGLLLLAGALALTYVRIATVALIVAGVVTLLLLRRAKLLVLPLLVAGLTTLGLLLTVRGQEHLTRAFEHAAIRADIVGAGVRVFLDHPFFGVGHGAYKSESVHYGMIGVHASSPHNLLVQVLAETGLVGVLGFVVAVLVPFVCLVRRVREQRSGSDIRVTLDRLALFVVVAYAVVGVVHFTLHAASVALIFWLMLGVGNPSQNRSDGASRSLGEA